MGLDQYAYRRLPDEDSDMNVAIVDWRKHNRLQGWMEQLWEDKGRPNFKEADSQAMGDFNCVEVEVTLSDLEQLEAHVENKSLPETGGFFFGSDSYEEYEEYHKETDLQFISEGREAIADGQEVYYSSWW
jgi:hypothetical protein|tara:strand:- start:8345 stop:8734 length:390 start_codon:yes stop_codon:yes gene_type:complete